MTNPALLVLARHYGRTDLYTNVRDNLAANLYVIEPNGEVETVHSRRQDQTRVQHLPELWLQYREMALRDGDGRFAAVAALLQERGTDQTFGETPIGERLAQVLDRPELAAPLPEVTSLPNDFEHHDDSCRLVRVRRGTHTASIFGGTDFPELHAISSGLSTNPTFFKMRKGAAILDSLRLAPRFFALGHFRAEGLERTDDGWRLHAEVRGAFHHPLPPSTAVPTAPTPSPTTAASGPRWTSRTARRSTAHSAPKSWSMRSAAEAGTSPSTSRVRAARARSPSNSASAPAAP